MIKDEEGIAKPLAITIQDTGKCISHVVCSFCKSITTPFEEGRCPYCATFERLYPSKPCDICGAVCERYRNRCDFCSLDIGVKTGKITVHDGPYDCMLYCNDTDQYFYDEWEAMGNIYDNACENSWSESFPRLPKYLYLTEPSYLELNAHSIAERACDDLYDEAFDAISNEELKELQNTLDAWVEKVGMGATWYPDYKRVIALPWDEFFESNPDFVRPQV